MSDMKEQINTFKEEELSSFAASVETDSVDLSLLDEEDPYDALLQDWDASNANLAARKRETQYQQEKKKPHTGFAVRSRVAAAAAAAKAHISAKTEEKEQVEPVNAVEKSAPVNPVQSFDDLLKVTQSRVKKEVEWQLMSDEVAEPVKPAFAVRNRSQAKEVNTGVNAVNDVPQLNTQPQRESVVAYRPYDEENEPELEDIPERGLAMFSKAANDLVFGKKEYPQNPQKVRFVSQVISVIFAAFLFLVAVVNFAAPDKEFSEAENRRLEPMPKLTISTIANGSFMSDFETSLTDQFVCRDFFVKMRTRFLVSIGKSEVNDVYIASNNYLIPKPPVPNTDIANATMAAINAVAEKKPNIQQYCAFIPRASYILSNLLPDGAASFDDQALVDAMFAANTAANVKNIRVSDALFAAAQTQQIYYRTDHHWTTAGAYAAFEVIAKEMGLDTTAVAYETLTISNSFAGTSSSSSGLYQIVDSVEICIPAEQQTYMVEFPQEGKKYTSIFMPEYLEKKDKYAVFFGGNPSIVNISTDADSVDTLLILKDSYANALVPMLTPYYRNIIMIDPRYYMESFDSFLQTHKITDILYLFSVESVTNAEALQRFLVS